MSTPPLFPSRSFTEFPTGLQQGCGVRRHGRVEPIAELSANKSEVGLRPVPHDRDVGQVSAEEGQGAIPPTDQGAPV